MVPGSYLVTESDPTPDYDLNDIVCLDGAGNVVDSDKDLIARQAIVNVDPGETVVCEFFNVKRANLTIVKQLSALGPANMDFDFTSAALGAIPTLTPTGIDLVGSDSTVFSNIISNSYDLAENDPTANGWELVSAICTDDADASILADLIDPDAANPGEVFIDAGQSVTCTFINSPFAIELLKTGTLNDDDGTLGVSAGDTISYAFTVTNIGDVSLTDITLADTVGGVVISGGPIASLAPAAVDTTTFTGTYTLTQVDVDAGTFTNTATVTGSSPSGIPIEDPDDDTQVLAGTATIDLVKTGTLNDDDGTAGVSAGDTISYAFTVTNIGTVTLTGITLADTVGGVVISGGPIASLAPAAVDTTTFTGTYTLTQADVDAGAFTNTATVTGTPPSGPPVEDPDDDTQVLAGTATIDLVKTANPVTYSVVDEVISYSYELTNSGNVSLYPPYVVTDDKATVTCPAVPNPLAPLASVTCTASYTITQADIDAGTVVNVATGTAQDAASDGSPVTSNEDTVTVTSTFVPPVIVEPIAVPTIDWRGMLLLTLMMLATGWYFRPAAVRKF